MIEKCPVCLGNGLITNGFYGTTNLGKGDLGWVSTSTEAETCRACNGKGYIIVSVPSVNFSRGVGRPDSIEITRI